MPNPADDHTDAASGEAGAEELMAQGAALLVDGVARLGAGWVVRAVAGLLDAWGGLDGPARAEAMAAAETAGAAAVDRVEAELRALFASDVAVQRATPLEIIRSLRREATAVLRAAGVPEVVRDPF